MAEKKRKPKAKRSPTAKKKAITKPVTRKPKRKAAAKPKPASKTKPAKRATPRRAQAPVALALATPAAPDVSTSVEDQVKDIVQSWAGTDSEPNSGDTLGALWGNRPAPFNVAANNLAGQLDAKLGAQIKGSDLTTATTVADVVNLVLS